MACLGRQFRLFQVRISTQTTRMQFDILNILHVVIASFKGNIYKV